MSNYVGYKPQVFDVALYRIRSYLPWSASPWISLATWSDKVHAGIIIKGKLEGSDIIRNLVCDATVHKIDVRPLSSDVLNGNSIRILRIPEIHIMPQLSNVQLAKWVWEHWGYTKYSFKDLFTNLWVEIVGPGSPDDPPGVPVKYMCSQMVSYLLRCYGMFDPCPQFRDAVTAPADLDRKSRLIPICEKVTLAEVQ